MLREEKKIFIVMEFCENGDMAQLIRKCKAEKDFLHCALPLKLLELANLGFVLFECL